MNKNGQAMTEFFATYSWAILSAIVVIIVLAIWFRPADLMGNNQKQVDNLQCTGEKLCEKFANANLSYYKDSLTKTNEIDYYCEKQWNNYTTEEFVFHVNDKNIVAEGCQNVTR